MHIIDHVLCIISALQSHQNLCEPGNNLNQTFPALELHIKKFKPTGTNTVQFRIGKHKFYTTFIQIENFGKEYKSVNQRR
jgi:hypothetical protein